MRIRLLITMAAVVCAAAVAAPAASAASSVYWTNLTSDTISFLNLDGTGMSTNITPSPHGASGPVGVAIDPETGKIYWASYYENSIDVANLDGSDSGELDTGLANVVHPEGLSIDLANGNIYWANNGDNTIGYTALDGSGTGGKNLTTTGATVDDPSGVTVDTANGRLYWGNVHGGSTGAGSISFANLDGTGAGGTLSTAASLVDPDGIAIDPGLGRIFWANSATNGNTISFASLDGSGGGTLNTGAATVSGPSGVAIDQTTGRIYWANESGAGSISWADVDGDGAGGEIATVHNADLSDAADPILFKAPEAASALVLTGATPEGSRLSCSAAAWGADLVSEFDYRAPQSTTQGWSLNGRPIAGATANTLVASFPGSYACESTATNGAGSTTQTSNAIVIAAPAHIVPPPGGPKNPAPTAAKIKAGLHSLLAPTGAGAKIAALLKHGYRLSFKALTAGKLTIDWYYVPRGARIARAKTKGKGKSKPKAVLVAVGTVSASKVGTVHLTIRVTSAGRRLLKRAHRLTLTGKATFKPGGKTVITTTRTFTLKR
jgi:DNA-binding beta-propeller fold protein YncE